MKSRDAEKVKAEALTGRYGQGTTVIRGIPDREAEVSGSEENEDRTIDRMVRSSLEKFRQRRRKWKNAWK